MTMLMYPVNSSIITATGYNAATKTAFVEFTNGALYTYSNVPPAEYDNLRLAPSVGSYFTKHFKHGYTYSKIREPAK